MIGSVCKEKS